MQNEAKKQLEKAVAGRLTKAGWMVWRLTDNGRTNAVGIYEGPFMVYGWARDKRIPNLQAMKGTQVLLLRVLEPSEKVGGADKEFRKHAEATAGVKIYTVRSVDDMAAILERVEIEVKTETPTHVPNEKLVAALTKSDKLCAVCQKPFTAQGLTCSRVCSFELKERKQKERDKARYAAKKAEMGNDAAKPSKTRSRGAQAPKTGGDV